VALDGREVLEATPSHPVWRVGSGWTAVGELEPGDRLATRTGEVEVTSVSRLSGPALVFNLSVEAPHTYFAGPEQVLSHNKVAA